MLTEAITKSVLIAIHRVPLINKKFDAFCTSYHRLHENFSYDHLENGERWLLTALARNGASASVFDVGANSGEWAALASEVMPGINIHCFEVCPPTYEKLVARFTGHRNLVLNSVGLSDKSGDIEIQYCPDGDALSSMIHVVCPTKIERIPARIVRGKDYCVENNISIIDLLKVDVEGAEHLVFDGFGDMITPESVRVVQFEYGQVNIVSKYLLRDFYSYFEARGYRVGKLFPNSVHFRAYKFEDENFLGPNYVAAGPEVARLLCN